MLAEFSAALAHWMVAASAWIGGLRETEVAVAAFEQLTTVGIAVVIAVILATPAGLILAANRRFAHAADYLSRSIVAIPSLALLGGITALRACVSFDVGLCFVVVAALPATLRGVLAATRVLDRQSLEITEILALSRSIRLRYMIVPLAIPVFVRGVRDASLAAIGASTLAALVGTAGCGTIILRGIEAGDRGSALIGSAAVVALALVTGALGELIIRATNPRLLATTRHPASGG